MFIGALLEFQSENHLFIKLIFQINGPRYYEPPSENEAEAL